MSSQFPKISPEELHNSGNYTLTETINYSNILNFIQKNLKPKEAVLWSFYVFMIFTAGLFGYFSVIVASNNIFGIWELLAKASLYSFVGLILVIPVHELIHGLAFKILGASKLTFGVNLRELVFYVTAHRFVLNKRMFVFLAILPFICINIFFGIFLFSENIVVQWMGAMFLMGHTSCCIGDFALMSHMILNSRHGEIYTYDDVTTKTSYFFRINK